MKFFARAAKLSTATECFILPTLTLSSDKPSGSPLMNNRLASNRFFYNLAFINKSVFNKSDFKYNKRL